MTINEELAVEKDNRLSSELNDYKKTVAEMQTRFNEVQQSLILARKQLEESVRNRDDDLNELDNLVCFIRPCNRSAPSFLLLKIEKLLFMRSWKDLSPN